MDINISISIIHLGSVVCFSLAVGVAFGALLQKSDAKKKAEREAHK